MKFIKIMSVDRVAFIEWREKQGITIATEVRCDACGETIETKRLELTEKRIYCRKCLDNLKEGENL